MKITYQQLEAGMKLLGRSLLSPAPDYANEALANDQAIAREESSRGARLLDVWLKVQNGHRQYFIWAGKNGANCRPELPPDADPAAVLTIRRDPASQPANQLLDQQAAMFAALSVQPDFQDSAAGVNLELADPVMDQPNLANLMPVLAQLAAATTEDYNAKTFTTLSQPLQNSIFGSIKKQDHDEITYQLQCLKQAGTELRSALGADCLLAGWLRIYPDICDLVLQRCKGMGLDERNANLQWVRCVGSGCAPGANHPLDLIHRLVDKGVREDLGQWMADLAQGYCDEGEVLVEQALAAQSVAAWHEALYGACLEFFMGACVYEGLLRNTRPADAPKLPGLKTAKNKAAAQQTLVADALLFGLKNRDGSAFARHRDLIRITRQFSDETAAETLAADFIECQYLYPRYFKPVLMDPAA
jgi:hypothetical protein